MMFNPKTKTNKPIIEVKNIDKDFLVGGQNIKVLKNISLKIMPGDFVIIFGPSGCGKSTLLHGLLGLEPPSRGEIDFNGMNLFSSSEDDRVEYRKKNIGMVYQQSIWIKSINVLDNITFPLHLYGFSDDEIDKRARAALRQVSMEEWCDHWPTELSSGQQQRVSLARALVTDPPVIVADEPTGNLDSASGKALMDLMAEQNKKGKTVIMVTHDLGFLPYANRIFHIVDGQLDHEYCEKDKNLLIAKLSVHINGHNKKEVNGNVVT